MSIHDECPLCRVKALSETPSGTILCLECDGEFEEEGGELNPINEV